MRTRTLMTKVVAGLGSAAFALALSACAHHDVATDQYGQIRTETPATANSSSTTVATVPAPSNAMGVESSSTPAVISGPVTVDSTGRAYTSSSVGSAGNCSGIGTNTDTNLIPKKSRSNVTVTESAAATEMPAITETPLPPPPAPVITETPAIVETPTPAPVPDIVQTPAPMSSSTTDQTTTETKTKHHRRMHKD
jgi:hypothetical protein